MFTSGLRVTTSSIFRKGAVKKAFSTMTPDEKFMFELNGYLVVRGLFSKSEAAAMNAAIDSHKALVQPRSDPVLKNAQAPVSDAAFAHQEAAASSEAPSLGLYSASGPRQDLGGLLSWPSPAFRAALAHKKLVPYLTTLLGEGYRLDHQPLVILQNKNSEGFSLHGGPMENPGNKPSFELQYKFQNGHFFNSLLAVSICLCETNPGDGGFVVVRGSHKLNVALPDHMARGESAAFNEESVFPAGGGNLKAGDVILFSEATVHGALPWQGEQERRLALYRFAPANLAYGRGYVRDSDGKPFGITEEIWEGMNEAEKAVCEGAYANRCERVRVVVEESSGEVGTSFSKRNEVKKAHDLKCFGTEYF